MRVALLTSRLRGGNLRPIVSAEDDRDAISEPPGRRPAALAKPGDRARPATPRPHLVPGRVYRRAGGAGSAQRHATQGPVFPFEVDETLYLLSQYGESEWVRNLRAAGRGTLRHKGQTVAFAAAEVDGAERERVIAAFRARTPKPFSKDFDQLPDAADHPTFRVQPIV